MIHCPYCGEHVVAQAPVCAQCGIAIQWQADVPHFDDPGDMVTLTKIFDPATQPVIESVLDAAGIAYLIETEVMQDVMGLGRLAGGYNAIFGPPVVKVPKGMFEAAREAIAPVLSSSPVLSADWEDEAAAMTPVDGEGKERSD